jgi:phosphoribosylglycinamide formyltransferase-1
VALNLGVLVSGNGTNLQAILDAAENGTLDARVRCVVSNRSEAFALERARNAGVPAVAISHKAYPTREAFDEAVLATLREHGVEWVALAGFMRVLTPGFLRAFAGRVVNVHPALLPSFPGVKAVAQALSHGVKVTGATVHFVDDGIDSGPIIAQRAVPVLAGDDEASLAERVHVVEHELFVSVLADIAAGRVVPGGRRRGDA